MLSDRHKYTAGLFPVADAYNGNPATDVVNMKNHDWVTFLLFQSTAGTNTGTAVVTVEACDNFTPSTTQAIPFRWRKEAFGSYATDVLGAVNNATSAGFTTTANENSLYVIEVKADELPSGFPKIRLKLTEGVNDPVSACVLIELSGGRHQGKAQPTVIA